MTELRWILLVLGALFVVGLAWWEWRRPRPPRDRGRDTETGAPDARIEGGRTFREPTLTLPEIRPPSRAEDLPILEVADESIMSFPLDSEPMESQPAAPAAERGAIAAADVPVAQPAPTFEDLTAQPIVEWPPEGQRRIVALRLVSPGAERFAGRQVRQALAAEGFVPGKMSIFHKAGPDGRAVLSAASLNKPGTFDPELMDTQRFTGINLFAVLPGPLPAPEAFDELLASARSLNDRLLGALQDERGEPLTQMRTAAIREQLGGASEMVRAPR